MDTPSDEQQAIINHIKNNRNVVVDACAGSGKSTTILHTALQLPHKRVLQVTYNSSLRHEIKDKTHKYHIPNMEIHTYHSFAVKYFSETAYTDTGIRHLLLNKQAPIRDIPPFDIIMIDEAQDMTLLYYQFIVYVIQYIRAQQASKHARGNGHSHTHTNGHAPPHKIQMMVLGDEKQGLYEFKGSDTRFLTEASHIWKKHVDGDFAPLCSLQMSYRITRPMADFVNHVMLDHIRLLACKSGDPVVYIRRPNPPYRPVLRETVVKKIKHLLAQGYSPKDIFILCASVRKNTLIQKIENELVEQRIPCHLSLMDGEKIIDDRVIQNKIVFTSFHSVKGRQRKVVIVAGFDNSYFRFYNRDAEPTVCPNTLYVATTRATEKMFLLEEMNEGGKLPFLTMSYPEIQSQSYIHFQGELGGGATARDVAGGGSGGGSGAGGTSRPINKKKSNKRFTTPSELIKFIPETVLDKITPLLMSLFITESVPQEIIDIPSIVQTSGGGFEDVSDLNGIVLPCLFYDTLLRTNNNKLHRHIDYEDEDYEEADDVDYLVDNEDEDEDYEPPNDEDSNCEGDEDSECDDEGDDEVDIEQHYAPRTPPPHTAPRPPQQRPPTNILKQMLEDQLSNKTRIDKFVKHKLEEMKNTPKMSRIARDLMRANIMTSMNEQLYFRLQQIQVADYKWINNTIIELCQERMKSSIAITPNMKFEHDIIHRTNEEGAYEKIDAFFRKHPPCGGGGGSGGGGDEDGDNNNNEGGNAEEEILYRFSARIDLMTEDTIWEIKCTSQLGIENQLQLIIYAWLWEHTAEHKGKKMYKLFNIKTGEILVLKAKIRDLNRIMLELMRAKYDKTKKKTTRDDFLRDLM